jgi:hypothetical protein
MHRLDEIIVGAGANNATLGADDSKSRVFQSERIADGNHPLSDFQSIGVAQRQGRQILGRLNF